jgi:hypothetical protein
MRQLMTDLERIQARARELARSGKFHGWRPIASSYDLKTGTSKRASGLMMRPHSMSLTTFAKRLA